MIDDDQEDQLEEVRKSLSERPRVEKFISMMNRSHKRVDGVFPICRVWDEMAKCAFENGADWIMLLGDDLQIECDNHYQLFYRSFLTLEEKGFPSFFGCPWWNDLSFPNFPTFPVVGRAHYRIFNALIPPKRAKNFVNQDLDPYLQRLYLKCGASPPVRRAVLVNTCGGNEDAPARYKRVTAQEWKDFVLEDQQVLQHFLSSNMEALLPTKKLVDVVIPSFRLDMKYLVSICNIIVPESWVTIFLVIVDNPTLLQERGLTVKDLENELLRSCPGKNIRVRNNERNMGAAASRNHGIDESSAEWILFLDDDLEPNRDILIRYDEAMSSVDDENPEVLGFIGKVRFPRSASMNAWHAGVLMSYLTFMFEITDFPNYENPAWGVTANIMSRRLPNVRFDTKYAKSGGGEDVDFCLKLKEKNGDGIFVKVPEALVYHPFWETSFYSHFFNWAYGDSLLFTTFPYMTYYSYPNIVEFGLAVVCCALFFGAFKNGFILMLLCAVIDIMCDIFHDESFQQRSSLLEFQRSLEFRVRAHILANSYVWILEMGRLWGHLTRAEIWNATRRFDWHCGCLRDAPKNFRRLERKKFVGFVSAAVLVASLQN